MAKRIFILAMLAVFTLIAVQGQTNEWGVRVQLIKGKLLLKKDKEWIPLAAGDTLITGDIIKTDKKSYAEIVYGEKIVCKLAENTELQIKEMKQSKKTIVQTVGKIWLKVQKLVGEKFEVETRFGTAGVRGTTLGSSTDPATGTEISCEEGIVYLRTITGIEKDINAGESGGFDTDGNLRPIVTLQTGNGFDNFGNPEDGGTLEERMQKINDLFNKIDDLMKNDQDASGPFAQLSSLMSETERFIAENKLTGTGFESLKSRFEQLRRALIVSEGLQEFDDLYKKIFSEAERWEKTFSLEGSNIDFSALLPKIDTFVIWQKENRSKIEETLTILNEKQSGQAIQLTNKFKALVNYFDKLILTVEKTRSVIQFEDQLFARMTSTREKIATYKREFEMFSSKMLSSAQWVEFAKGKVAQYLSGQTPTDYAQYKDQARQWRYFMQRYDALRGEFSDYEKIVSEAKRKGVFFISGRVSREGEEMVTLITNFKVKKGCCQITMNFGQLKQIFMVINSFLNAEGKVLLQ